MNCTEARDEFSALLDGELAPDRQAAVEAHLAECTSCLRELDKLQRVDALYSQLHPRQTPADFEDRVSQALREKTVRLAGRGLARKRFWPVLAAAATLVAVSGIVWLTLQKLDESRTLIAGRAGGAAPRGEPVSAQTARGREAQEVMETFRQLESLGYLANSTKAENILAERAEDHAEEKVEPDVAAPAEPQAPTVKSFGRPSPSAAPPPTPAKRPAPQMEGIEQLVSLGYLANSTKAENILAEKAEHRAEEEVEPDVAAPAEPQAPAAESLGLPSPSAAPPPTPVETPAPLAISAIEDDETGKETGDAPVDGVMSAEERAKHPVLGDAPRHVSTPTGERIERHVFYSPLANDETSRDNAEAESAISTAAKSSEAKGTHRGTPPLLGSTSPPSLATTRKVKDRTFTFRDGRWRQEEYDGQKTTFLARGSKELNAIVFEHKEISEILTLGLRVIFRLDKTWYEVGPRPENKKP